MPEALALLSAGAQPIAGGTDLLALMKNQVSAPRALVSLHQIAGFNRIIENDAGLCIGAGALIADLMRWPTLTVAYPLLAQACATVAWPEIRAMATVGGNLCQRPRCWYFRHPLGARCLKRGGDYCYPVHGRADGPFRIFGESPCVAVHPSDLAPALVALGAQVTLTAASAERTLPLTDFYDDAEPARENILSTGELLSAVHVPRPAPGTRAVFLKSKRRPSHDFSHVSVALSAQERDGVCSAACVVLGSVALRPWRLSAVEQLLEGQTLDAGLAARAAELAITGAQAVVSERGTSNAGKIPLVAAQVRRALLSLSGSEQLSAG